jgi:hypothetical protein
VNVADVMDELGDALDTISGLRVFPYWVDKVSPPAAIVGFPEELTYDATYGRGSDSITLPIIVVVGRVNARSTRDRVAQYTDGTGMTSAKTAIESHSATSYDSARVERVEFGTASIGGTEYLAATFHVDITGSGA